MALCCRQNFVDVGTGTGTSGQIEGEGGLMRVHLMTRLLCVTMLAVAGTATAAQPDCGKSCRGNWISAWGTAQQLAVPARAIPARETPPAKVAAQTVRMVARSTVAGRAVRVALSNS